MYIEHNSGWHTTSESPGKPFLAMFQGMEDSLEEVTNQGTSEYGDLMCIVVGGGVVYITKEQAKAFFDLRE